MKKLILLIVSVSLAFMVSRATPNYAGTWTGYITQKSLMALASNYHFSVYLEINGHEISGYSQIRMWDEPEIFAEMALEGTFDEYGIQVRETEITKEKIYTYAYWCIKLLHMTYSVEYGKEYLKGTWASDSCSGPGEIFLERARAA